MRTTASPVSFLLALVVAAVALPADGASSASRFKFKSGKHETGVLYRYVREDLEGTKTGAVLVYVAGKTKLEVLRLGPGKEAAELSSAEMAWDVASVKQLDVSLEKKGQGRVRAASATLSGDTLSVTVQDQALYRGAQGPASFSVPVAQLPVHLATLDFVTLGLAMRHLAEPDKEFDIGVVSTAKKGAEGAGLLAYLGAATVAFVEDVDRDGIPCSKYKITGPALGGQEGFVWLVKGKDKGYMQDAEIPLAGGDWPSIHLSLKGVEKMSEGAWDSLKSTEVSAFLGK